MSKYWIFDSEDTPQQFPLSSLVARVRQVVGRSDCRFFVRRSEGYGLTINRWNDLLDDVDEISVLPEELEEIAKGTDEWFYNLEVCCMTTDGAILFGVHDSTALFVEAPEEIAKSIIEGFVMSKREF